MKTWRVSDARWANLRDLQLPLWREWNRRHALPRGFWQRIWEYPYVASRVPAGASSIDIGGTYPFVLFSTWPRSESVDVRDLNEIDHPLHRGLWPEGKLVVADATAVPREDDAYDHVFSISAIEEMPDPVAVLHEMLRLARHRVVLTVDVSDELGLSRSDLRLLEQFLGVRLPPIPADVLTSTTPQLRAFKQSPDPTYRHIRVLGLTIDATTTPKSTAVLIPHWESWPFLERCVASITAHRHTDVDDRVYVLDDGSRDGSYEAARTAFRGREDVEVIRFERDDRATVADVGRLIDLGLEHVTEQYVAAIDADLFPLSDDWLAFPIWLIERYDCSAVGLDTGLSASYTRELPNQNWWQPSRGYLPSGGLYDNEWFVCINNLYRVMPTAIAQVVSEQIGFARATLSSQRFARSATRRLLQTAPPWRALDRLRDRYPYVRRGADNGVAANHFIDVNRLGPKFNIPLTSYIGLTPYDGAFGQNISGLAFHFALSTRALSRERREVTDSGVAYRQWVERLSATGKIDDELVAEMIAASRPIQPGGYDGSIPAEWYEEELAATESLRAEFHRAATPDRVASAEDGT